jgi:hypothetical protein
MCVRKYISLGLTALMLLSGWGCAPRFRPEASGGVTLQPGRYLNACYRAPDFAPARLTYSLTPFSVDAARGLTPETFGPLFQAELAQALKANGLELAPAADAAGISGAVHLVKISGPVYRFIFGKISADLIVSGSITQGEQTLFAFQDRVQVSSPANPGLAAPKEVELLLRLAVKTFAAHLLTELLIYGVPEAAG